MSPEYISTLNIPFGGYPSTTIRNRPRLGCIVYVYYRVRSQCYPKRIHCNFFSVTLGNITEYHSIRVLKNLDHAADIAYFYYSHSVVYVQNTAYEFWSLVGVSNFKIQLNL